MIDLGFDFCSYLYYINYILGAKKYFLEKMKMASLIFFAPLINQFLLLSKIFILAINFENLLWKYTILMLYFKINFYLIDKNFEDVAILSEL